MRAHVAAVSLSLLIAGCSEETKTPPPTGYKDDLHFETGAFEVPPGDSFECFYTTATTTHTVNVTGAYGKQGPGGHHITVYYTDTPRDPEHHPCNDAEMVSWHMVAGADVLDGQEPTIQLPDGVAFKIPEGKQMVIQVHYINTTGKPMTVNDEVTVTTTSDDKVKEYGNFWTMVDTGFSIEPNSTATRTSICTLTEDIDTLVLLGHMHELGSHYTLEQIDDQGNVVASLYDQDWTPEYPSHPPTVFSTLENPFKLPAGTRLRQTCTWNNTTPDLVLFPREMCLAFAIYFPDRGELSCDPEVVP